MKEFGDFIANRKWLVFIISIILLILSVFGIAATKVDYDFTTYLPEELESIQGTKIIEEDFDDLFLGIMKIDNLKSYEIVEMKNKISEIDSVKKVLWIDDIIDPNIPKEIFPDKFSDILDDNSTTYMLITFSEPALSEKTEVAVGEIRKLAKKECFLGGVEAMVSDLSDLVGKEMSLIGPVVAVLLILVLALTLGSILIPFIIFLGAMFSIAYNMGTNVFMSEVSPITISLASVIQLGIVFVLSIFLYNRYRSEREIYEVKEEAMSETLSSLTPVVGIIAILAIAVSLSVLVMSGKLSSEVAILCTKGIIFSSITTITIFPVLILLCDGAIIKLGHNPLLPSFENTTNFVLGHYKGLSIALIAIFILGLIGKQNININYNAMKLFPQDLESIAVTNEFKDEHLAAPTMHFITVNNDIDSHKLAEMSDKISKVEGISSVVSEDLLVESDIIQSFIPESVRSAYVSDKYKLIIVNSDYEPSSREGDIQSDKVKSIVKQYDKNGIVTGDAAISKDLRDIAENDLVDIKVAAVVGALLVIALAFASWSIPIILVFAVQATVFAGMGILFYFGQGVPPMILDVIGVLNFALVAIYSVFLTYRFREELISGKDKYQAIGYANENISKSIIACALPLFISSTVVAIVSNVHLISIVFTIIALTALIDMVIMILMLPAVLTASEDFMSRTSLLWTNRIKRDTNLTEKR